MRMEKFPDYDEQATMDRIIQGVQVGKEMGKIISEELAHAYLAGSISAARWQYKFLKEKFAHSLREVKK